jgi:isoleucyl-tRNA synthetase
VLIPALDKERASHIQAISELVMSEVNVKEIELLDANNSMIVKTAKADFKKLGPKYGKQMKQVAAAIQAMDASTISVLEQKGTLELPIEGGAVTISKEDVELVSQDIPGWSVASDGDITVALDITLTPTLTDEGLARELVNKVQNLRKDLDLEVTDRIMVEVENRPELTKALISNKNYICSEILAERFELVDALSSGTIFEIDLNETLETKISIARNQ